jgi:hypothetical protein
VSHLLKLFSLVLEKDEVEAVDGLNSELALLYREPCNPSLTTGVGSMTDGAVNSSGIAVFRIPTPV